MEESYLLSVVKQFEYYKKLGENAMAQVTDAQLLYQPSEQENAIAAIVKHLVGNMLSRWTDFLTADGEKEWRNRDDEFVNSYKSREILLEEWNKGWQCLFGALSQLLPQNLNQIIFIRNEGHTVTEAINRQMMHYAYHIGQIVVLCKQYVKDDWKSLSIPLGNSVDFNRQKFSEEKSKKHFTDDL